MTKKMLTVMLDSSQVSRRGVAQRLKVEESDIDPDFGVVLIDPKQHLYAVMVDDRVASEAAEADGVGGPFADPEINSIGPPEP